MKLIQLQFLLGLKRNGSFSKTAQEMYVSQPVISVAVKNLEEELGRPLLERNNKGITFTRFGELVLEQAEIVERAVNQIRQICYREDMGLYGAVCIGTPPHLGNTMVLKAQMELIRMYPNLELKIQSMRGSDILPGLERNDWSLGLLQMMDLNERQCGRVEQDFWYEHLFYDQFMFVAGKDHPLTKCQEVTIEDILSYPYVSYISDINPQVKRLFKQYRYPEQIIYSEDFVRMRKYVAQFQGLSCLPGGAIAYGNLNYREKLVPIRVKGVEWVSSVGIISKNKKHSEAEECVIQLLKMQCHKLLQ